MKERSRTKNVTINSSVSLLCQVLNLLLNFLTRTIFIKVLGAEYLGVNGLFTNILTILSFAELGIGNAIVFNLYKPLAQNDNKKISSLMLLYKKAYTIIGLFVMGAGVLVTPFLEFIIKTKPNISENISLLYILFLLNTAVSYFFVYKKNIIIADQKNYITLIVTQVTTITKVILQTVFLLLTHNFVVYLVIQIVCTLAENFVCSALADRMYPYLKNSNPVPLSKTETKSIFADVKALAIYKFGSVILNGTDNILISMLLSVRDVGLASNYTLLMNSANSILGKIIDAFTASVGNLNTESNPKKQYDVFKKIMFISSWIYGFATAGMYLVSRDFIITWIGEDYLLGTVVVFAMCFDFYVKGVQAAPYMYRTTLGLFVQGKWAAIVAAITNLVLSVVLCKFIGLAGIFIATPIARLVSTGFVDPYLVYKRTFKRNVLEYFGMYIGYLCLFIVLTGLSNFAIGFVTLSGWGGVIVKAAVVTIIFNILMVIIFFRTQMFKELVGSVKRIVSRSTQ